MELSFSPVRVAWGAQTTLAPAPLMPLRISDRGPWACFPPHSVCSAADSASVEASCWLRSWVPGSGLTRRGRWQVPVVVCPGGTYPCGVCVCVLVLLCGVCCVCLCVCAQRLSEHERGQPVRWHCVSLGAGQSFPGRSGVPCPPGTGFCFLLPVLSCLGLPQVDSLWLVEFLNFFCIRLEMLWNEVCGVSHWCPSGVSSQGGFNLENLLEIYWP